MLIMKPILTIIIILIFLLFTSFNISTHIVNTKYNKISGINSEISNLRDMVEKGENKEKIIEEINSVDKQIRFMNSLCFEEDGS